MEYFVFVVVVTVVTVVTVVILLSSLLFDCDDNAVSPSGDGGFAPAKDEVVGVDMRMMKRIRMMLASSIFVEKLCFLVIFRIVSSKWEKLL